MWHLTYRQSLILLRLPIPPHPQIYNGPLLESTERVFLKTDLLSVAFTIRPSPHKWGDQESNLEMIVNVRFVLESKDPDSWDSCLSRRGK